MEEDRRFRYRDKILWILNRIGLIEAWSDNFSGKEAMPDTKTLLAIFKAYQEVVEAIMDIIAMYLRDQNIGARDDYSNIERIDLLSEEQKEVLRGMNGLRNRIIHRYNSTDERLAMSGIVESLTYVHQIIMVFDKWLNLK
jgi:uncharacterized protein YutE (UPF0331/DUF86 family)